MLKIIGSFLVLVIGLFLVGLLYWILSNTVPDRGVVKYWEFYGTVLLAPYLVISIVVWHQWRTLGRLSFLSSIFVILVIISGIAIDSFVYNEFAPAINGAKPPDMPISGFLSFAILIFQYFLGIAATLSVITVHIGKKTEMGTQIII